MKLNIKYINLLNNINVCPKCGSESKITDSRMDVSNTIKMRTHECIKCRKRWSTAEINQEDLEYLLGLSNEKSTIQEYENTVKGIKNLYSSIDNKMEEAL